jgi:tripartite ATP-independent transporter DctM subunit
MSGPFMILLAVIAVGMTLRVPIAFTLIAAGIVNLFVTGQDVGLVAEQIMTSMYGNYVMLAVPLFILTANLMNAGSITDRLWRAASAAVGRLRGGDAHVTVVLNVAMSSMSGSAIADAAGPGLLAVHQQVARGYPPGFAVAISAAAATLAPIIPPSIAMILYCIISNTSISAMFLGGVVPGLGIAFLLMLTVAIVARWRGLPPGTRMSAREVAGALGNGIIPLTLPVVMLGGIWGGAFTPTEAAAIGGAYALFLGFIIFRALKPSMLPAIFTESMRASVTVMMMIAGAFIVNYAVAAEHLGDQLAMTIMGMELSPLSFMLLINVIFLLAGCFLDTTVLLLVVVPLLMPTITALGIDPVHFGVVIVFNIVIGLVTPPYGMLLFVLGSLTKTPVIAIFKEIWIFIIPLILALVLLVLVPELVLWLPHLVEGGGR